MKRRLLAALMCLCMLVGLLPTTVLAAGGRPRGPGGGRSDPETYDAYYYILDPDKGTSSTRDPADFTFIGRGSVDSDLGRPDRQNAGKTVAINSGNASHMTVPKKETQIFESEGSQVTYDTYPDITYDHKTYVYAGKDHSEGTNTYTIEWYRYSSSTGYNVGEHSFGSDYCWHVDGYVRLSDKVSVTYKVKFPGDTAFSNVGANGEKNGTAFTAYAEENTAFSAMTQPGVKSERTEGSTTYQFDGWYYDEACTNEVGDDAQIDHDIVVYGKYVTKTVAGDSQIDIQVYLDGEKVQLTEDNRYTYIADVANAGGTPSVTTRVNDGKLIVAYSYENYDAVDLKITPADSYVLQGVSGTFIYGMSGCSQPEMDGSACVVDNVDGTTTLTVYLNTSYTVTYDVPDGTAPTDTSTYITVKGLDNFSAPDFSGITSSSSDEEKNTGKDGGWVNNALKTNVALAAVPENYTGWYTTNSYSVKHSESYTGDAIKTAANNKNDGTPTVIECYAAKSNPNLKVTKTVVSVGGTTVTSQENIPEAVVGDLIIYKIVVENTGNVDLTDVAVTDTLGDTLLTLYSNADCTTVATTTNVSIAAGGTVPYYAKYTVAADDAGKTLINSATATSDDKATDTGNAPGVTVKPQYTLTVNSYYDAVDGTPFDRKTYTIDDGGVWAITVTDEAGLIMSAPKTVKRTMDDGTKVNYTFDAQESTSPLNGTMTSEGATVDLVYSVDEIGDGEDLDEPDGIPDKYQVTVNYVAEPAAGGTASMANGQTTEVLTIMVDGNYATTGTVTAAGATATAADGYFFENWTKKVNNGTATTDANLEAATGKITLENVKGGDVITFTANFTAKVYDVDVTKTVDDNTTSLVPGVGDTLTYTVKVENKGNVALENVVVTDTMWGDKVTSVKVGNSAESTDVSNGNYTIATLEEGGTVTITYTYTIREDDIDAKTQQGTVNNKVTVTMGDDTLDSKTEETTVIGDIIVQPADITVYMGGDGYEQVAGTGGVIETDPDNGLPVPGFYVTLPDALDDALKEAANVSTDATLNLSGYLSFQSGSKTWTLELYDGENTSIAFGKYIYRLVAGDNQAPVRMQFTDQNGVIHTDDTIDLTNMLYNEYDMSIYPGAVDQSTVKAAIKIGEESYGTNYAIEGVSGKLTIRGVTQEGDTTEVVTEVNEPVSEITAVVPEGITYTINGSIVQVVNGSPALLVDNVAHSDTSEELLTDKALETLKLDTSGDVKYEFRYLDLVDANNGNTWITPSKAIRVYWPVPEDATENTKFYLVHFEGLDREMTTANIEEEIANCKAEKITVYQDENGLYFETASFSPFALVYVTPEDVTVTFDSGKHGDFGWPHVTSESVEIAKGGSLTDSQIPTVYEDSGYEFIGWYKLGDPGHLYTSYAVSLMPITENTTFIAQYRLEGSGDTGDTGDVDDEYDVIYNANYTGGSYPRRMGSYDAGEKVTVSENKWFERDGYVFVGWNTEADGTGDSYAPDDTFRMPDSDVYLYAQWQKEKPGPDDTGVSDWLETDEHNAYLTGYPDSTFRPDRNMTRAEVAQMFYALLKNKNVTVTASFSDVPAGAWYATAVNTMASLGMMDGYPDGTFHPDAPITRAEFATVALAFAYDPARASCSYTDVSVGAWYYTYVAQATTYGWIGGYYDGSFRPNNPITRTEVCVIVNNMLGRTPDKSYINRNEDELVDFADLSSSYWGYYTIMEATNDHEYTGNYISETWTDVN